MNDSTLRRRNSNNSTSKKAKRKEAQKLLDEAEDLLKEVDDAEIFRVGNGPRQFAPFQRSELRLGYVLGLGSFSLVREIRQIRLDAASESPLEVALVPSEPSLPTTSTEEEDHYDATTARQLMARNCLRHGVARYAIKQLQPDLSELELARGMIDLAIEAKFLSAVSHPNIIKMRNVASCGPMKKGYFLVLDRLYNTLEERIKEWRKDRKSKSGIFLKIGADKESLDELLLSRMIVAYDLASAFRYLHENKLVYRDIKSANIGFDVRDTIKVFDFGLCKSLSGRKASPSDGTYKLSGLTGSFPYMAPEVALCKPYNLSADVFSFGMLLWEIFALKLPFQGLSRKEYFYAISVRGKRPKIPKSWPALSRQLIADAWTEQAAKRPTFRRIAQALRSELHVMSTSPEVKNRTDHMLDRTLQSTHFRRNSSKRLSISSLLMVSPIEFGAEEIGCA